jgi:Bacterial PH domain
MVTRFRLAPMSPLILILTLLLLLLPIVVFVVAFTRHRLFALPALFLLFISAWTWLWFRPTAFVVNPTDIEVIWPLRRRRIRRNTITAVRRVDRQELRQETGWALRVGAGGLWGGFGFLWTARRGLVRMYVSRLDDLVWIERGREQPWLLTPEQPDVFVHALSHP